MAKLEIEIKIRKMLKPSTPNPNHLKRLNLSLFDHPNPSIYVPLLLHYLPSSEWNTTAHERCHKLQKSLAEALAKFYPLAGRFNEDELTIHCNDEGIDYIETKVNADLAEFLHDGPKIELLSDLLPLDVIPKSDFPSPLLGIQVNIFNCGGMVMGILMSHVLADAFTLATFLNEWSHIVQTGTSTDNGCLSSFGHLPSLFPIRVISRPEYAPPPADIVTKIVTRRFVFHASSIAKLKAKIESSDTFTKPTRTVVVMSLIWKALVSISSSKHGSPRDSTILFAINLRGRSNVPSTEHALGNFCLIGNATVEANRPRKELNDFVNLVGSKIRDTSFAIGKASIDETSSMLLKYNAENLSKYCQKDEMDIYVITSWCKFPWYEIDFGWGKPYWVSGLNYSTENIILFDTKDGEGIEAWVALKENDMTEFERHPDILPFVHV